MRLDEKLEDLEKIEIPDNVMFLEVEGLDCMGKETYCRELASTIRKKYIGARVIELTFPDYNSIYGKAIAEDLKKPSSERSASFRDWFYLDMYYAIKGIEEDIRLYSKEHPLCKIVVVCDRYLFANIIYNKADDDIINKYKQMIEVIPKPDMLLFLRANSEESKLRHQDLLSRKEDKDVNELDYSFQEQVDKAIGLAMDKLCMTGKDVVQYDSTYTIGDTFPIPYDDRVPAIETDADVWLDFDGRARKTIEGIIEHTVDMFMRGDII